MITSFISFLALFAFIGISSAIRRHDNKHDYYVASRSVSPMLAGLSAVATNNSGYMFIGVIGYTYATGLASIWLMLGWIIGDYLSSTFIHSRLHRASVRTGAISYSGLLSNWQGHPMPVLQKLIALVSLFFLLAYAGAQLVAGSKALQVLLEWPSWAGAVIGAAMVALYCVSGGIRASIWTDAAQSVVMIVAMSVLLFVATRELGGITAALEQMNAVDGFMDWFPQNLAAPGFLGGLLFALGWGFAGFSVIGQPHIMIRFMTLAHTDHINQARLWYYLWFSAFYLITTGVGLLSRIYLADTAEFDAELALPSLALQLLPPVLVGLVLAGIFAATMSTADSLILSCSAALSHDLLPKIQQKMAYIRAATLAITVSALLWALLSAQSVFDLVIMAWSGLASAFSPLLIMLSLGCRPSQRLSILALGAGLGTAIIWRYLGWHDVIYEGMPGILVGLAVLLPAALSNRAGNTG